MNHLVHRQCSSIVEKESKLAQNGQLRVKAAGGGTPVFLDQKQAKRLRRSNQPVRLLSVLDLLSTR
jgi:hypothetical protein